MRVVEFKTDKRVIRRARELKTIAVMVHMFCRVHHHVQDGLCAECNSLLEYARRRLDRCPFGDAKPTCNKCLVHCYSTDKREQIRVVMRWAGPNSACDTAISRGIGWPSAIYMVVAPSGPPFGP